MKVEHTTENEVNTMHVLNRSIDNTISRCTTTGFEPYLHIKSTDTTPNFPDRIRCTESTDKKDILGNKLTKIICFKSTDVGWLRKHYFEPNNIDTYEADIVFTKRYMIDKNIKQKNDVIIQYDMECATDATHATDYDCPTTVHCCFVNDVYHQFVWHQDYKKETKEKRVWVDRIYGKEHQWNVYKFTNEKDMLIKIARFMRHIAPDVISEFSRQYFDVPWLVNRMQKFKLDPKSILPSDIDKGMFVTETDINIPFIEVVNICKLYKMYRGSELDSYSLDAICRREFKLAHNKDVGKYKFIENYTKAWQEDTEEFLKYNLCDVELMVNLDKTLKLFAHQQATIDYTGCEFNDIGSNKSIARVYLYRKAKEYGFVANSLTTRHIYTIRHKQKEINLNLINTPTKKLETRILKDNSFMTLIETCKELKERGAAKDDNDSLDNIRKKGLDILSFEGAYVGQPSTNTLQENIWLYDWKSMYPKIIIASNMSPETLVSGQKLQTYRDENRMNELHDVGNGVYFKKEPMGFLPRVLTELFDLRYSIKDEMKKYKEHSSDWEILDNQQLGIKSIINSFYGIMKLICFWVAESTTFKGREMILWTIEICNKMGNKYLYSDTDSVYCVPQNKEANRDISAEITKTFQDKWHVDCEIECEGHFKKGIFFAKKRYALMDDENNMKFRGIEIRRSDNSKFLRNLQEQIIRRMFEAEEKSEIMKYIKTELKDFNNRKLTEIGIPHKLSFGENTRNNYFHKGAMWSNAKLKKEYAPGDKPYYIRAFNHVGGLTFDDDDDRELIESKVDIDYIKHKNHTALAKVESLFECFGWNMTDLYNIKRADSW